MFRYRKFVKNEDGLLIAVVVLIGALLVGIWFMSTIAATIIPIAIFLILLIVMALIVKSFLKPGGSLGIIRGASGAAKSAGREGLGLYDSAKREYKQRRK